MKSVLLLLLSVAFLGESLLSSKVVRSLGAVIKPVPTQGKGTRESGPRAAPTSTARSIANNKGSYLCLSSTRGSRVNEEFTDAIGSLREWYQLDGCDVLLPADKVPRAIVHFCGGFVAGSVAPLAYGPMLSALADSGFLVVNTPIPAFDLNHGRTAKMISQKFATCYAESVVPLIGPRGREVPVIGLSHSLGGKLMALSNSRKQDRRKVPPKAANIFLAFNNYSLKQSIALSQDQLPADLLSDIQGGLRDGFSGIPNIPNFDNLRAQGGAVGAVADAVGGAMAGGGDLGNIGDILYGAVSKLVDTSTPVGREEYEDVRGRGRERESADSHKPNKPMDLIEYVKEAASSAATEAKNLEFTPSAEETWDIVESGYGVGKNVLLRFAKDDIDQSGEMGLALKRRGGCTVDYLCLPGGHMTPVITAGGAVGAIGGNGDNYYDDNDDTDDRDDRDDAKKRQQKEKEKKREKGKEEQYKQVLYNEISKLVGVISDEEWSKTNRRFFLPAPGSA